MAAFSQELFDSICDEIATSSKGLRQICEEAGTTSRSFHRWIEADEELRQSYMRARDEQADFLADEILSIADDGTQDTTYITDKQGNDIPVEDKEWTNRSKLRVEARKWIAAKLKPKKYGDKLDLNHSGQVVVPILNIDPLDDSADNRPSEDSRTKETD